MVRRSAAMCSCVKGNSVPQRLSGLQHDLDSLDRLRLGAEGHEGLALSVQEELLVDPLSGRQLAPAEDRGEGAAGRGVVVADVRALVHLKDARLQRGVDVAAGC